MEGNAFLEQWDRHFADWCAGDLMPEGLEAALLIPLARHKWAASGLVEHAARSDDYRHRKAAAILAGLIQDPPRWLLDDLFERESERNALAPPESLEPLCCQSVVEDIVFAAARWCRSDSSRGAGLDVLRKVIERTLIGEYWSTACYAVATLCRYADPRASELLRSFAEFAFAPPPMHPANPSLSTEREFVRGLMAGWRDAIDAVEPILDRQVATADSVHFDAQTQAVVDAWLAEARKVG